MKPIIIRDSTLREGIELPGVELSLREKIEIVKTLEEMNVPEIEIGMPYGMKSCLPLAKEIKTNRLNVKTSVLVLSYHSSWEEEINMAAKSDIDRIEILFPSSDILLRLKDYYKIDKENLSGSIHKTINYAKKHFKKVGMGFVDATRTDISFLAKLAQKGYDSGADRLIVYDTVGIATPSLMKKIVHRIKQKSSILILVHCHNDFGLATANSLAGIEAGADAVDVVVNGLGDRGGNAPFEEVVLALEKLYGVKTGIKLESVNEISRLVEEKTGIKKCKVKPVVGAFTFLHSPVQHIRNAASGNYRGFEPFEPELIGAERKYAFTLPVDYTEAIKPFYKKLKADPGKRQQTVIMNMLRKKSRESGLSEKEIIILIKKNM